MAVLSDVYLHPGHMHEFDLHREKGILTQLVGACLSQALHCSWQLECNAWIEPHPWSHLMLSASFSTVHFSPTPHSMASSSSSWKDSSVSIGNTSLKPSLHAQQH